MLIEGQTYYEDDNSNYEDQQIDEVAERLYTKKTKRRKWGHSIRVSNSIACFSEQFFSALFSLEAAFFQRRDSSVMQPLLEGYTDCVQYFHEQKEAVAVYFESKISQVAKEWTRRNRAKQVVEGGVEKTTTPWIVLEEEKSVRELATHQKLLQQRVNDTIQFQPQQARKQTTQSFLHAKQLKERVQSNLQEQDRRIEERRARHRKKLTHSERATFSSMKSLNSPFGEETQSQRKGREDIICSQGVILASSQLIRLADGRMTGDIQSIEKINSLQLIDQHEEVSSSPSAKIIRSKRLDEQGLSPGLEEQVGAG